MNMPYMNIETDKSKTCVKITRLNCITICSLKQLGAQEYARKATLFKNSGFVFKSKNGDGLLNKKRLTQRIDVFCFISV